MLSLFDVVRLKKDDNQHGIKATFCGTIIDVIGNGEAYTVEFVDSNNEFIDEYPTYTEDQLIFVAHIKE